MGATLSTGPAMRLLTCLLILLLSTPVMARGMAPADAELMAIDRNWNVMRLAGDADALEPLIADDWLLTHSDGRTQTKDEYLDELRTRSRTNNGIENRDVALRRYGETAVVTGTSVQSGITDGKPWEGQFRFTRVWVQREGRWQMVASHSSRIAQTP